MKTIARTVILILFSLIFNNCSLAQVNKHNSTELFVQFKELFQKIDLPINWKRRDIGKFAMPSYGQKSRYHGITEAFYSFMPQNIINSDSTTYIRALFQLPPKNDIHLFIIVTDYMYDRYNEGELYSIITQLYLIGYDNSGKLLFYKIIAGAHVDEWDKLFTLNLDYTFETKYYEILSETIKHPYKNHLIGKMAYTKTTCEITTNEIANCVDETIIGYFDLVDLGNEYELIKVVK